MDQELGWSLVSNVIVSVGIVMAFVTFFIGIHFRIDGNKESSLYGKFILLLLAGGILFATASFVRCENDSIREHQERMQSR